MNIHHPERIKTQTTLWLFFSTFILFHIYHIYILARKEKLKRREKRKKKRKEEEASSRSTYSYVIRICASKLSETTHTKEKVLKTVPRMLFCECPPSHIFLLAYKNNHNISCITIGLKSDSSKLEFFFFFG